MKIFTIVKGVAMQGSLSQGCLSGLDRMTCEKSVEFLVEERGGWSPGVRGTGHMSQIKPIYRSING